MTSKNWLTAHRARAAVNQAVRRGKLPRVKTLQCVECGGQAEEYHHHISHKREHYLDVIPLCKTCHLKYR
jgi:hypothetical protein